jgi:hypothetical protein
MTRLLCLRVGWVALGLFALSGCGGGGSSMKRVVMSGNVTYDGTPVEDGTIIFTFLGDSKGSPTAEGAIKGGRYKLLDVIPGKNTVSIKSIAKRRTISKMEDMPKGSGDYNAKMKGLNRNMKPEDGMKAMGFGEIISGVPTDAEGNNATITVPDSGGTQDFPLTKPGGKK